MNNKVVFEKKDKKEIRSFVMRGGRLTSLQQRAIELYSKDYCIPFSEDHLNLSEKFGNKNPVIIEIGFGMGISTAKIAEKFPDKNFLGIEVFQSGVGKLLDEIVNRSLKNIRIIRFNAIDVLDFMIKDNSINGFHIFFPDPWPKKRHHKRRLVKEKTIKLLVKKLLPGGYMYTVTDWSPYAEWMLEECKKVDGLVMKNGGPVSYCEPVPWRPLTKFEEKGLKKEHTIQEIWLEKR